MFYTWPHFTLSRGVTLAADAMLSALHTFASLRDERGRTLTRDDLRMIGRHVLALLAAFHRTWDVASWQQPDDWLSGRRDHGWNVGGVVRGTDFEGRPIS
jgi:hypothetical protein